MAFLKCVFKVILSVLALNIIWPIETQTLTGISVILGKKQYYIETTNMGNFFVAAHACAQYDMALASIETDDEWKRLISILKTTDNLDKRYWLSGTFYGSSTTPFKWLGIGRLSTNSSVPHTAGACIATNTDFYYVAETCTATASNFNYICEKPVEPNCGKFGQCRYTYSSSTN